MPPLQVTLGYEAVVATMDQVPRLWRNYEVFRTTYVGLAIQITGIEVRHRIRGICEMLPR